MPPDITVHPAAPPNDLSPDRLRIRPSAGRIAVTPGDAGWRYLSFRVEALGPADRLELGGEQEAALVVLAGGGVTVETGHGRLELPGRRTVFDGLPWAAYIPPGTPARIAVRPLRSGTPVAVAVAEAPPSGRTGVAELPLRIGPRDVRVEVRGAGSATRQITHIVAPDFPADRLEIVEVYTPSGNWSSWPPHKHDVDEMPQEAVLEEVYCYQFRRPEAWGVQRLYRRDGTRDAAWAVSHGEIVIVTDGYHPFVATHGDDAYYLNALAGDRRTMACSFDPDLDWVPDTWEAMERDPRVPLVTGPDRDARKAGPRGRS